MNIWSLTGDRSDLIGVQGYDSKTWLGTAALPDPTPDPAWSLRAGACTVAPTIQLHCLRGSQPACHPSHTGAPEDWIGQFFPFFSPRWQCRILVVCLLLDRPTQGSHFPLSLVSLDCVCMFLLFVFLFGKDSTLPCLAFVCSFRTVSLSVFVRAVYGVF